MYFIHVIVSLFGFRCIISVSKISLVRKLTYLEKWKNNLKFCTDNRGFWYSRFTLSNETMISPTIIYHMRSHIRDYLLIPKGFCACKCNLTPFISLAIHLMQIYERKKYKEHIISNLRHPDVEEELSDLARFPWSTSIYKVGSSSLTNTSLLFG